jgi:hypothetical protein
MYSKLLFCIPLLLSLACLDARPVQADLGFECLDDQSHWVTGKSRPLSNAGFGVRRKDAKLEAEIANCGSALLVLTDEISISDYEGLLLFRELYPRSMAWGLLSLDSTGGDLDAAVKIGRLVRKLGVEVNTGGRGKCYSSCVLVLSGGMRRYVFVGERDEETTIGIHRPYLVASTQKLTSSEAGNQLSALRSMLSSALEEFNISTRLVDDMMAIPPERVRLLTGGELELWGLSDDDPVHQSRSTNRWAIFSGISHGEMIQRRQIAESVCRGDSVCATDLWKYGETPPEARTLSIYQAALESCARLNPNSNGSRDDPSVDYEKRMKLMDDWAACRGQYVTSHQ